MSAFQSLILQMRKVKPKFSQLVQGRAMTCGQDSRFPVVLLPLKHVPSSKNWTNPVTSLEETPCNLEQGGTFYVPPTPTLFRRGMRCD